LTAERRKEVPRKERTRLHLVIGRGGIGDFLPIFRTGVGVAARLGCSLEELLCGQFQIDASYVDRRITTIFLDGKPVDAVGATRVLEGSTLALSAAMPGLAGAILRRGGALAPLRGDITREESGPGAPERDGVITVKLFNLLGPELAPGFLRRGVLLPAADPEGFLRRRPPAFWDGCREILLDGRRVEATSLKDGSWAFPKDPVALSVALPEM
jgi:hypothetical protein